MKKIKPPRFQGFFYPESTDELKNMIENFKPYTTIKGFKTRAVIVPHAGLIYSGDLAFNGISLLDSNVKNIFIFAPSHRVFFQGISLLSFDSYKTPFGEIEINKEILFEIEKEFNGVFNDPAFQDEHSIEVEIPLIQKLFKNVKIVPILIGNTSPLIIKNIIEKYYKDKNNAFIISSDLSHFLTYQDAKKLDFKTAEMIEGKDFSNFKFDMACGALGILGLKIFTDSNNFSLIRIGMKNSGDVTGDKNRVVGYGCWALYEKEKNDFIKEFYSDFVLDLCKKTLEGNLEEIKPPSVFMEMGASFVTLNKFGNLRGCIGSIIAQRELFYDLIQNTKFSANNDPRFKPVVQEELKDIEIAVSLLSEPIEIKFEDENDLLNKIVPNKDGIIIKDRGYQAVYLPIVWEQLPDKKMFLNSLKLKAGLSSDYFSKTFKAYKFRAVYIK